MSDLVRAIFAFDVAASLILVVGAVWSVAIPKKRIWPPPGKRSWQYLSTWMCFCVAFSGNAALLVLDWNSWVFHNSDRLFLGIPLAAVGGALVFWGAFTLGARNTSGVRDGLICSGPYRFTRNPQYLGDIVMFVGLSLCANSLSMWITHGFLILVFLMAPWAEEVWLKGQYGEAYENFRRETPRFL